MAVVKLLRKSGASDIFVLVFRQFGCFRRVKQYFYHLNTQCPVSESVWYLCHGRLRLRVRNSFIALSVPHYFLKDFTKIKTMIGIQLFLFPRLQMVKIVSLLRTGTSPPSCLLLDNRLYLQQIQLKCHCPGIYKSYEIVPISSSFL